MADKFGCTEGEWNNVFIETIVETKVNDQVFPVLTSEFDISEKYRVSEIESEANVRHAAYSKQMRNALIEDYIMMDNFLYEYCDDIPPNEYNKLITIQTRKQILIESVTGMSIEDAIKAYEEERK